jgi:GPI mannosyltransferase 3
MRARAEQRQGAAAMPWPGLHAVAAGALALRLLMAWWSENISYPDELFQYLEQAHRLVFGYGFVPWEYRFGARNWLLPAALAALLQALRSVGIDQPSDYIPILRSVFAVLSISVVYASYAIGRNIFGEQTGQIAAIFSAVWYELLYASTIPTPEVLGAYALFGALALATGAPNNARAVGLGLLLGLGVALRLQYSVPATAIGIMVAARWGWRSGLWLSIAGLLPFGFAGLLDAWAWGKPFVSYYNSVLFNVIYGVSSIFGTKPLMWYAYRLTLASAGLHAIAMAYGVLAWSRTWPILLVIACVLAPHMLIGHKEYRFVFLTIPLLLVLLADGTVYALARLPSLRGMQTAAIAAVILVSAVGCVVQNVPNRNDRLLATLDLSRRTDVAALLDLSGPWHLSGGFYYLHRNVPYYFDDNVAGIPETDIRLLASHLLIPDAAAVPTGFREAARYGKVVVLEQTAPPETYTKLPKDGREPQQPGVDDRLTPNVRPRY